MEPKQYLPCLFTYTQGKGPPGFVFIEHSLTSSLYAGSKKQPKVLHSTVPWALITPSCEGLEKWCRGLWIMLEQSQNKALPVFTQHSTRINFK